MKKNKTFVVFATLALLLGACNLSPTSPTPTPFIPVTGSETIGMITAEETLVESGSIGNLIPVVNTENLFNNHTVHVTNGGIAKLDFFVSQISIRLFNDTEVGGVKIDASETANPYVRMKLAFGGLSGEVTKNGRPVQVELTNGVNIFVLGTQFLVLYDPVTGTTYIGNFDGTVAYSLPGRSVQFTQERQLYEISSNFEVKQSPLTFTRTDIDNLTSSRRATLLSTLRDFLEPTPTPTPTTTPTLFPTSSPTITPTPTKIIPCNKAAFVADVTIPDGTSFSPGAQFTKVWRIRNAGTCTWTNGYSLIFYRGDQMGGPASVNIPSSVAPGQTVDVAVGLLAPAQPGSYRGDWMLRNASGTSFGAGPNGATPIWVKINVMGLPDLTVLITSEPACTYNQQSDQCVINVEFVITNPSNVDVTNAFQIVIEGTASKGQSGTATPDGDFPSKTITVYGLVAGASQNFNESLSRSGRCYICTAIVTVDPSNYIIESNETNNESEKTWWDAKGKKVDEAFRN